LSPSPEGAIYNSTGQRPVEYKKKKIVREKMIREEGPFFGRNLKSNEILVEK
jgi:hypothetical protein